MNVLQLSRDEARRIAIRAQLLDADRPDGLLEVVDRLTMLQRQRGDFLDGPGQKGCDELTRSATSTISSASQSTRRTD